MSCHKLFRRAPGFSVAVLLLAMLVACGKEQSKTPPTKPPVPVKVAQAVTRSIPLQIRAVGTVEAHATVEIRARVSGQLTDVHFREGQDVSRGAPLFTIDPEPYRIALRQAEAQLQKNQALAVTAREKARRYQTLTTEGLISQQDFELIRAEAESLEASVKADRSAVEDAKLQLGWTRITAPLTGRTGSLLAHAGDLISANGDQPLVVIHQIEPIDVSFTVPEKELLRLRSAAQGGRLTIGALLPGEEQHSEVGELSFIDNAVDTKTGTIRLKGSFKNVDRRLWPGQFVTTLITLDTLKDATVVPTATVQTGQQGTYVYVAKNDGTAELRAVKTGVPHEDVTVVTEGLHPGETVVVDGQLRLYPDAKLEIKKP